MYVKGCSSAVYEEKAWRRMRPERRELRFLKVLIPCFLENLLSNRLYKTVPQTDTGGRVENTKALERTRVKELGKIVP